MIDVNMEGRTYSMDPSKIICLIRSYAAHARELGNDVPASPVFFLKPPSALLENGGSVLLPEGSSEVHHEVELALVIGKDGKNIGPDEAFSHILGYTVMLDITDRELQKQARSRGLPWTIAKGYDTFAPIGPVIIPAGGFQWRNRSIWLDVNGVRKQNGNTDMLLWTVERIISEISGVMTLKEGDIIMTGTPEGVGPLREGDHVRAGIEGICEMHIDVKASRAQDGSTG